MSPWTSFLKFNMHKWRNKRHFPKAILFNRVPLLPSSCPVRVGQLSHYSQVLLLPLGVPPMPAPACSHTKSFPRQ